MELLPGMVLYACYAYLSSIYFTCQTICIMCGDIVVVMIYMAMNNLESEKYQYTVKSLYNINENIILVE